MEEHLQPCRLLSLCPELRNRIYLLVLEGSPGLVRFSTNTTVHGRTRQLVAWRRNGSTVGDGPNLLATCHQIHDEATPILYGSNSFLFGYDRNGSDFPLFIDMIGTSARYLRNVELEDERSKKDAAANFVALRKSGASLNKLRLGWWYRNRFTPSQLAVALGPLIRSMEKQRRMKKDGKCAVNKLIFTSPWFLCREETDTRPVSEGQAKELRESGQYSSKVKAALLAMLK